MNWRSGLPWWLDGSGLARLSGPCRAEAGPRVPHLGKAVLGKAEKGVLIPWLPGQKRRAGAAPRGFGKSARRVT